jgi:hypothetical protein
MLYFSVLRYRQNRDHDTIIIEWWIETILAGGWANGWKRPSKLGPWYTSTAPGRPVNPPWPGICVSKGRQITSVLILRLHWPQ